MTLVEKFVTSGAMSRVLVAAVIASLTLVAAGCGSRSMNELVSDRFGDGAGRCHAAGLTELGKVYSCQNGKGGTLCLTRDGDDLFIPSQAQIEQISC